MEGYPTRGGRDGSRGRRGYGWHQGRGGGRGGHHGQGGGQNNAPPGVSQPPTQIQLQPWLLNLSSPSPGSETSDLPHRPTPTQPRQMSSPHAHAQQFAQAPRTAGRPGRNGNPPRQRTTGPWIRDGPDKVRPAVTVRCNEYTNELKLRVFNLPPDWNTLEIHESFKVFGEIVRIDVQRATRTATVAFCPLPTGRINGHVQVIDDYRAPHTFECKHDLIQPHYVNGPVGGRQYPSSMTLPLQHVGIGVEQAPGNIQLVFNAPTADAYPSDLRLTLNLSQHALFVVFKLQPDPVSRVRRHFRLRFRLERIKHVYYTEHASARTDLAGLTFAVDHPPTVWEKMQDVASSHLPQQTRWEERHLWHRQTDANVPTAAPDSPIQLRPGNGCIIDFGRWLTYHVQLSRDVVKHIMYSAFLQALEDNNVKVVARDVQISRLPTHEYLWGWMERWERQVDALGGHAQPLPFPIHYQLEVCLSRGILHESNLSEDFLRSLMHQHTPNALRMLEVAADTKEGRFYDPFGIFGLHLPRLSAKRLDSCAKIPAVTVTPCTIYVSTPVPETSNRVVRKFKQYEDRFLRVRFTDEKPDGRLFSNLNNAALYRRVARALSSGIVIAGRHYEFLAFGNSQIREHGAYFFASTSECTANDIRRWMGNFDDIKVIAKYASRLGQCFSTTHAIPLSYRIEAIPDVVRNGYCFTDGVGKISPLLAKMIALYYGKNSHDPPSVYQFRLAGCKGILTVDPHLTSTVIQMRPSQEKFKAVYGGLEIIKSSKFSAAHLNQQVVLVLSALGVADQVFLTKLEMAMHDIEEAMEDSGKASVHLRQVVDENHMTLTLANMVEDGFMDIGEPFTMSCLRLWRAWTLKLLKEKARIPIKDGAFVLGTTDETATLQGQVERDFESGGEMPRPQIFLQVSDEDVPGVCKIIEGPCIIGRNPCLHPGDVRVVEAVDVPALHHLRDCVVLPQTGFRDLANMCSGGDLDGDDYFVIWDQDLLPGNHSHAPMDYTPPDPLISDGPVTVQDLANFFVSYMQNDNLGSIATHHRYWADYLREGASHRNCRRLAQLHSEAVDYVKTGVPAIYPHNLRPTNRPHWAGDRTNYHSKSVLGRLYDMVEHVPYAAGDEVEFDHRILNACEHSQQMDIDALELKHSYDVALERVMAQYGIQYETEVFTTLVLNPDSCYNAYKFKEVIGEAVRNLREQYQTMCYEKIGTTADARDWAKLKPFLVAMYAVTAREAYRIKVLTEERAKMNLGADATLPEPVKLSFPWIFSRELGRIANERDRRELVDTGHGELPRSKERVQAAMPDLPHWSAVMGEEPLVQELMTEHGPVPLEVGHELDIFLGSENVTTQQDPAPGPQVIDLDVECEIGEEQKEPEAGYGKGQREPVTEHSEEQQEPEANNSEEEKRETEVNDNKDEVHPQAKNEDLEALMTLHSMVI